MKYIGFVVDGLVPTVRSCFIHRSPQGLFSGRSSQTAVAIMRFGWVAATINKNCHDVHYELYRPWRRYCAVIFLKSMSTDSICLMRKLNRSGVSTIFDANVDYFTPASGTYYYEGMAPTANQQKAALIMAGECDGVIGDSQYIADIAGQYAKKSITIEDNIKDSLIVDQTLWSPCINDRLNLLWSGQAIKLFELLAIKDVLLAFKDRVHLKMVTNSLQAIDRWEPVYKKEFELLIGQISHEFIDFTNIDCLMEVYDLGGVFISPRFLNNTYNLGHTEWKITLPMSRGRIVLCSPLQSYSHVRSLAGGCGIHVCEDEQDWLAALSDCTSTDFDWQKEQEGAIAVVKRYYSTGGISKKHLDFVTEIIR